MHIGKRKQKNIHKQLCEYFGVDIHPPKVKIAVTPQTFSNYYTGIRKLRSIKHLLKVDSECEYFYDDKTESIIFKGFQRTGAETFTKLSNRIILVDEYVHESIHHFQLHCGGFGKYLIFDEVADEICTWIITGKIEKYAGYSEWIMFIWNLLNCYELTNYKKYELIKNYNVSSNKHKIYMQWCKDFIKYHDLKIRPTTLCKMLDGVKPMDSKLYLILKTIPMVQIVEDFYKLLEKEKIYFTDILRT